MLALFHLLPSWGLFPSFLPSVSPRVAEDYSTVIGMALDNNSLPALFFHMDDVSGRVSGCVFFWGLVSFLPSFLVLDGALVRWGDTTTNCWSSSPTWAERSPRPCPSSGGFCFFLGGWGFFPSPLGWVWTRDDVFQF